jgi:hypothetical protein
MFPPGLKTVCLSVFYVPVEKGGPGRIAHFCGIPKETVLKTGS